MVSTPTYAAAIAVITLQIYGSCLADVIVSFKFISFKNSASRTFDNDHCDGFGTNQCDHIFIICVDKKDGNDLTEDKSGTCAHGTWTTAVFENQDTITFDHDLNGVGNPIQVTIPNTERSVRLKVQVWDKDRFNKDDHVDNLDYRYVIVRGSVYKNRSDAEAHYDKQLILGSRSSRKTSLTVDIVAYCSENYYTTTRVCDKFCQPQDDNKRGHFICTDQGSIKCRQGWIDDSTNCTSANISCRNRECQNNGTCIGGKTSLNCSCPSGFTGEDCSLDIDECNRGNIRFTVCDDANTSHCENTSGSYKCVCKCPPVSPQPCIATTPLHNRDNLSNPIPDRSRTGPKEPAGLTMVHIGLMVVIGVLVLLLIGLMLLLMRERRLRHLAQNKTKANLINGVTTAVNTDDQLTNQGATASRHQTAPPQRTKRGVRLPDLPELPPAHAQHPPLRYVCSIDNQSYLSDFDGGAVCGNSGESVYEVPLPEKQSRPKMDDFD